MKSKINIYPEEELYYLNNNLISTDNIINIKFIGHVF